jgi:uncharacterized protein (TIGR02147 family)
MSIFEYKDIKSYLKHSISQLPKKGRGEITRISRHLKVSPTLVSHVLSGEKSFTLEQAQSLISYFGLIDIEADYFLIMVQLERAGSQGLKVYFKEKLDKLKAQSLKLSNRLPSDRQLTEEKRSIFYSSPVYMMARLYTSVGDKGKTLSEIAHRFEIPILRCSEILGFLVDCGLCDEKFGRFTMGPQKIHLGKSSPHLLRFQTDWRMRAISRGEDLTDGELMFTAPVSLAQKDFEKLREGTINFIKNFLDTVHASNAEELACLNLDLFWIKK